MARSDQTYSGRAIISEVATEIRGNAAEVFSQIVPIELPLIFKGHWPLPAVRETREQQGDWLSAGQTRVVVLSDGSSATEQLLLVEPHSTFRYRVSGFTGALGKLADYAEGQWWFEQQGEITRVRWRYAFTPRNAASAVLLRLVSAWSWQPYMEEAIAAAKRHVEHPL